MTERNTMTTDDDRFDQELGNLLADSCHDTAPLSRAVFNRLSGDEHTSPAPHLSEVLIAPAPMGAGFALLLLLAGVLGYAALPGADEIMTLVGLADLAAFLGGL